jgi:hypothetical protein
MIDPRDDRRDHPLTCHWHPIDLEAYDALRLPHAASKAAAITRAQIVTEAFIVGRANPNVWISYSRRKEWYVKRQRYWPATFSYLAVTRSIDQLAAIGLLEHQKMPPFSFGWQSRFRASPALIQVLGLAPLAVVHDPREMVILRDADGNLIDYSDSERTHRMRRNVREINEAILATALGLHGLGSIHDGDPLQVGGRNIGAAHNRLHRVFNRASFGLGGRFYGGWWQNISKDFRQRITTNGSPTVELDYPRLHPTFLYAQSGRALQGDPYEIAGWDRTQTKIAFNTLVNAGTRIAAVRSIANRIGGDGAYDKAEKLVSEIEVKHRPIAQFFGTGAGLRLMRRDSDLADGLMLRLIRKKGVVALPIHDSFIVAEGEKAELMEAMAVSLDKALKSVTGNSAISGRCVDLDPQYGTRCPPASEFPPALAPAVVVIFPDLFQRDLFGGEKMAVPASEVLDWRGGLAPTGVRQALLATFASEKSGSGPKSGRRHSSAAHPAHVSHHLACSPEQTG